MKKEGKEKKETEEEGEGKIMATAKVTMEKEGKRHFVLKL